MASKQRKSKCFTGTRSNPPGGRSAETGDAPAATSKSPVKTAGTTRPPTKPARPAPLTRHVWAPPRLSFAHDIPSMYHETYIRMIPRGPHHVFSFWEMGPDALEKVKVHHGAGDAAAQPVLRLYTVGPDKGERSRRIGDIALPPGIHSHYVRVPESGRTYRLDLGVMTPSGRFVPVCQSNEAATPRARVRKAADSGHRRGDTRKLIDFSLLSGRIVAEAEGGSGALFSEDDGPFAVGPDDDVTEQRTTASSWGGQQLTPDTSTR